MFAYLIHSVRDVNYVLLAFFFSLGGVSFRSSFCSNDEVAFAAPKTLNHPFPIKGSYFFIDLKYTVV